MRRNGLLLISFSLNVFLLLKPSHPPCQSTNQPYPTLPYGEKFDQQPRLPPKDLSIDLKSIKEFEDDIYEWDICKSMKTREHNSSTSSSLAYCPFHPTIEQRYQLQFFAEGKTLRWPDFSTCVLLPPTHYQWPRKYVPFPSPTNQVAIAWPNLGLKSYDEVRVFNEKNPKNIYHFNAPMYDVHQEESINIAAQYIPFGKKIRIMLEIGAGGGSISIALSKRYDVTVLNTIRPEFPYCEYITERGGLCLLLDSRRAMPFAKFTFDVIHHSWVYHGSSPSQWRTILLEQNRLLRPGGYLWMQDGTSYAVHQTIKFLLVEQLGYRLLYSNQWPRKSRTVSSFGSDPFELNWNMIFIKPNRLKQDMHQCA